MRIGYITHRKGIISRLGNSYLDSLCVRKHATHGHHFHEKNLPPLHKGDILLCGHTHVPKCIEDGEDIVFANTCIVDDSDKSRLLQLMLRKDAFCDERFPAVSNAVKYYKETKGGQEAMCEAVERLGEIFAESRVKETRIEMIRNFLNNGGSEIDAQNMLGASSEEVEQAKALMLQSV